jgi:hypothetical protein
MQTGQEHKTGKLKADLLCLLLSGKHEIDKNFVLRVSTDHLAKAQGAKGGV